MLKMSSSRYLDLQYSLSKNKLLKKPSRLFSKRDRQDSSALPVTQPNEDEMKRVFDKFDTNKDGKISQEEYTSILKAIGKKNTISEVPNIFKVADLDGDGFIDFYEFLEAHRQGGGIKTRDIQSAFHTYDLNGDGKITAEEILQILKSLGERCNLEDCRRMVRAVDADGDGVVDMDEFMTMMNRTLKSK